MFELNKSKYDKRKYVFTKMENDLEVLLIRDKTIKTSSCAMLVDVGSLNEDILGLAHFIEHMLFMGNNKYPDENYFQKMLSMYNGKTNAYTTYDHTCYFFSVSNNNFYDIFDVFIHFFISPLFNKNAIEREMNAINAEYLKNYNNDNWRMDQMVRLFIDKMTPIKKFNTGNFETLNIPNIREKMIDFYNKYYSSNIMKLVILSKDKSNLVLDKIESNINMIKNNNINPIINVDKFFKYENMISNIISIKDENILWLIWEFPYTKNVEETKIIFLFKYIFENYGENTIINILKKKNYLVQFSCDINFIYIDKLLFLINIKLTNLGFDNNNEVVNCVISYINFLKNVCIKKYYDELYNINKLNYVYVEKNEDNFDYILNIARNMINKNIDKKNILINDNIYQEFDNKHEKIYNKLINIMVSKFNIILASKLHKLNNYMVEKWYDIKFNVKKFNYNISNNYNFNSPSINNYVANTISLYDIIYDFNYPIKIDTEIINLWYFPKNIEINPYVTFNLLLIPKNDTLTQLYLELFVRCVKEIMYDDIYNCYKSRNNIVIESLIDGLLIKINCFNNNIINIIKLVLNNIINFDWKNNEKIFNTIKNGYAYELSNYIFEKPYIHALNFMEMEVSDNYTFPITNLIELKNITYEIFMEKIKDIINNIDNKCLICGNIIFDDIIKIIDIFKNIKFQNIIPSRNIKMWKNNELYFNCLNKNEKNSAIVYSFKIGKIIKGITRNWGKKLILSKLLYKILSERFYDQLRTKEQLGYIVTSFLNKFNNNYNPFYIHNFVIQSPNNNANYIKLRCDDFLNNVSIEHITKDEFKKIKKSELNEINEPFQNIDVMTEYYFDIITSNKIDFDLKEKLYYETKKLKLNDIIKFFNIKYINGKRKIIGFNKN